MILNDRYILKGIREGPVATRVRKAGVCSRGKPRKPSVRLAGQQPAF